MTPEQLTELADPFARILADGCPDTVADIVDAAESLLGHDRSQTRTSLFSEVIRVTFDIVETTTFRAMTVLDPSAVRSGLGNHGELTIDANGILIGLPQVGPNGAPLADPIDVIAPGEAGNLHFYQRKAGVWTYMGSSLDIVTGGYRCEDGLCMANFADTSSCAACHVGGGLALRDVNAGWTTMNDAGNHTYFPPTDAFEADYPELGPNMDAATATAIVKGLNREWNRARFDALKQISLKEVLRPLFCTLDIEFVEGSKGWLHGSQSALLWRPPGAAGTIDWGSAWRNEDIPTSLGLHYTDANGDVLHHVDDEPIGGCCDDSTVRPVITYFMPKNAFITRQYIQLITQLAPDRVVDKEFRRDVLSMDMTRALGSEKRCSLLDYAPDLPASQMRPATVRAGFIANLADATEPHAVEFRDKLATESNEFAPLPEVDQFVRACYARNTPGEVGFDDYLRDWAIYSDALNRKVRSLAVSHGDESFGIADVPALLADSSELASRNMMFEPETCQLVEETTD